MQDRHAGQRGYENGDEREARKAAFADMIGDAVLLLLITSPWWIIFVYCITAP